MHFLGCKSLERSGLAAMSFGFIAEIVAVVMVIFHSLMLAGMLNAKLGKVFSVLVWTVLVVGFLIVNMLAVAIYTTNWDCNQVVIPNIRLSDHFDYNYGFGFAVIGYISALLVLCVQCAFTSTKDGEADQPAPSVLKGLIKVRVRARVRVRVRVRVSQPYPPTLTLNPNLTLTLTLTRWWPAW